MENFPAPRDMYPEDEAGLHQTVLLTDLGEKRFYDSVAQCNRCGRCGIACPTFALRRNENRSPRGRNQTVRMTLEERLSFKNDAEQIKQTMDTCTLCGACMSVCYSRVATPEHVLETLRSLRRGGKITFSDIAIKALTHGRSAFGLWIKIVAAAQRFGLLTLAEKTGLLRAAGLQWFAPVARMAKPKLLSFSETVRSHAHPLEKDSPERPACLYFTPCSVQYAYPEIGHATINLLQKFTGPVRLMENGCCGFLSYIYGDIADSRAAARGIIERYEELCAGQPLPLVTDCPECAAFLKRYEQLFIGEPEWRERARTFAASVKNISEMIMPERLSPSARRADFGRVSLHYPAGFANWQKPGRDTQECIKRLCAEQWAPLENPYLFSGEFAGYFARRPKEAELMMVECVRAIARNQSDTVVTLSPADCAVLSAGLKKNYRQAKVLHFSVFVNSAIMEPV